MTVSNLHTLISLCLRTDGGQVCHLRGGLCRHLDRFVTVLTDTLATLYYACVARLHGGRVSSHHEDLTASVRGG